MYYRLARLTSSNPGAMVERFVTPRYKKLSDLKKDIFYTKRDNTFTYAIVKFYQGNGREPEIERIK